MKIKRGKPKLFFLLAGLSLFTLSPEALELTWKYRAGDKYRILSTVDEDVYVNRRLAFRAEFLNRIGMEIVSVSGDRARFSALFEIAEKSVSASAGTSPAGAVVPFHWARDYRSEFEQDKYGTVTVGAEYYMPMVRNVPVFPERDLKPGDTWSAAGTEVHDFRDNYGIAEPYRIPFNACYTFLGERRWKEQNYPAFSVSYRIFFEPGETPGKTYPLRILGASDQIIYWDSSRGLPAAYEESFRTVVELSDGQIWEYRGRAGAEVVEAPPMDKEELAREIAGEVTALPDVSVRVSDAGVVISLDDIEFDPDSSVLRDSERPKLDRVSEILMKYPGRDILVGGHTALAGDAEGRLLLSLRRAGAVADYLLGKRVRTPDRVMIRGYGAEQPVADNDTPEGMRKNRRVEITILEN